MPLCPDCQQPAAKRNGHDRRGRQKYACCQCRRTFTEDSASAFSGYRWSRDVILTAVRWYLAYPLSSRQVLELLAERGIHVSHRTVLNWVQAFGPQLAAEVRRRRCPVGTRWMVDMVCTQVTKPGVDAGFRRRDHVPDLHLLVRNDYAIDEKFHEFALLIE